MKSKKWMCALGVVLMVFGSALALAKQHGQGRGKGQEKQAYRYSRHERSEMKAWYRGYRGDLPPGLAKKDRLPPGLEMQLRRNGTLPPGLREYIRPAPPELVRLLPPPPPDCEHVAIGGRIVLLNRQSFMVLDVFKLL